MRERGDGVTAVAFGDIFLEDIRHYREQRLNQVGMKAIFPIWKRDTRELALKFRSHRLNETPRHPDDRLDSEATIIPNLQ